MLEGDWLEITATDKHGREISTWTWPIHQADYFADKFMYQAEAKKIAQAIQDGDELVLSGSAARLKLNTKTGYITEINSKKRAIPFLNGPKPIGMKAEVDKVSLSQEGQNAICRIDYNGGIDHITWTMYADGRVHMELVALKNASKTVFGFIRSKQTQKYLIAFAKNFKTVFSGLQITG